MKKISALLLLILLNSCGLTLDFEKRVHNSGFYFAYSTNTTTHESNPNYRQDIQDSTAEIDKISKSKTYRPGIPEISVHFEQKNSISFFAESTSNTDPAENFKSAYKPPQSENKTAEEEREYRTPKNLADVLILIFEHTLLAFSIFLLYLLGIALINSQTIGILIGLSPLIFLVVFWILMRKYDKLEWEVFFRGVIKVLAFFIPFLAIFLLATHPIAAIFWIVAGGGLFAAIAASLILLIMMGIRK